MDNAKSVCQVPLMSLPCCGLSHRVFFKDFNFFFSGGILVFDRNSGIITLIKVLKYREMIGLLGPVVTGWP